MNSTRFLNFILGLIRSQIRYANPLMAMILVYLSSSMITLLDFGYYLMVNGKMIWPIPKLIYQMILIQPLISLFNVILYTLLVFAVMKVLEAKGTFWELLFLNSMFVVPFFYLSKLFSSIIMDVIVQSGLLGFDTGLFYALSFLLLMFTLLIPAFFSTYVISELGGVRLHLAVICWVMPYGFYTILYMSSLAVRVGLSR